MMNRSPIPYGRQDISREDIDAVVDILRSDFLTQGPAVGRFERSVADYCHAGHAVAVNSATSALHIACLAAGLGPGDILWTSPNTFVASANCGLYCGASVDFVDIDPNTYNMSVVSLEKKLKLARQSGRLPKVVIPVHFSGQSCEMKRIAELGREFGFTVIEDASHAIGGRYLGKPVGSCQFSDMTVFSFHPVKIVTTGEGGGVVTNNEALHDKLIRLRSHGITRDPALMKGKSDGGWYYQQLELGFNYRMTDLQAALGISQMSRLDAFVARRNELAGRYDEALSGLPVRLPFQDPGGYSAFHLYVIRVLSNQRDLVFDTLRKENILVNVHYIPVHLQPYYRELGFSAGDFPEAEHYYKETISLPLFPKLSEHQQDTVISCLKKVLS
ncbi:MAG: UDP-4-amino-4,6-dideoxy-N-acetyl-beta-L-altrosamine transaminase [Desulfobacterales bacterium]|nr:UDP-4-amino-4,6-dideoxy-N-acetyl-beta-L-altrosamine transaminase [Desulfobacterales bacterium]